MIRKFSFCLAALLAASPALAQSVVVSESAVRTQALSPTLGGTDTLAVVSPALAEALIAVPVTDALPPSGEVSATLGETQTLAVVTPAQAEALIDLPTVAAAPVPQPAPVPQAVPVPQAASLLQIEPTTQPEGTFILSGSEPTLIDALPRLEPDLAATILVEPLTVDPNAPDAEESVSLYVVGDGTILPASEWSAADSEACKTSGGVELPLPGGRIACFKI